MSVRIGLLVFALALAGCDGRDNTNSTEGDGRRPESAISVLVDLSETWHNPISRALNQRLFGNVGTAIARSAYDLPLPLSVRYHIIGSGSLGRQAPCAADFAPSTFSIGETPPGTIRDRDQFRRYIAVDCPELLLAQPAEPATEISAAIVSAHRAAALLAPSAPRTFILLSDFKEEAAAMPALGALDLRGIRFLLVYRTLPEDRQQPDAQDARLAIWQRRLEASGAAVILVDENAVLSSFTDFQALIGRNHAR
ncbi:hypothetical protein ACFQRC_07295 [Enterovirga sp. GCM10030262]|uniref:hypothetical protein n=1 Tax=Enterovirga sp. GCM10030262 TaxID=3273391 RepID=UPI00360BBCAF